MGHASDIERQVAIRGEVGQDRDDGAGVGMPVGEIGKDIGEIFVVDLAGDEIGERWPGRRREAVRA
jgi:hypothetical protein